MKKRTAPLALLLAALLLLSLAACGGPAPAPADQGSEGEAAEPAANALPAPYYLAFAPGEETEQDLDGDGAPETVSVWVETMEDYSETVRLTVDGQDLSEALSQAGQGFDCPDDQCWLITDLDAGDGTLEIAIQDWGPSDDLTTRFFRYDGGELRFAGGVEGFVSMNGEPADAVLDGKGGVRSFMRLGVLQTWWGAADSALDENGVLTLLPQDYYASNAQTPQQVRTLCDLFAYDEPDGRQELLPAGADLELLGTDDVAWVRARLAADGRELWLHLDPDYPFSVEGPDGLVDSWDAIEGLHMAD